jgi:hypothetical protein
MLRRIAFSILLLATCAVLPFRPAEALTPGTWSGWYQCAQGKTGLTLEIQRLPDNTLGGRFIFYPMAENPGVPSGEFEIRVVPGFRYTFIEPVRWLRQPYGYQMVAMAGQMDERAATYVGQIGTRGCNEFFLRRVR